MSLLSPCSTCTQCCVTTSRMCWLYAGYTSTIDHFVHACIALSLHAVMCIHSTLFYAGNLWSLSRCCWVTAATTMHCWWLKELSQAMPFHCGRRNFNLTSASKECMKSRTTTLQKQKGHFNPAGGISVASSLPKNVHTGRSITLFAQHNTFMAPIIKEICTAKPKRLL